MIFRVEEGAFGYKEEEELYSNVAFELVSGEILAILGVNGSGKTTLLKCMMGFLKWRRGRTLIDQVNILELPETKIWRRISYVPQVKGIAPPFSAEEMVVLGRAPYIRYYEQPKESDYKNVLRIMTLLGIEHLRNKKCNEMSGGELQMVLIARALISNPELIILDEPESNLDFRNQLIILNTLKMLVQKKHIMCIINTHYPEHALRIADKTLIIDSKTKKCLMGKASEIITKDHIEQVFDVKVGMYLIKEGNKHYESITPLSIV